MNEAELHSLEAAVLGQTHAEEHARSRQHRRGADDFLGPVRGAPLGQTGQLSDSAYLATDVPPSAADDGYWNPATRFALPLYAIHAVMLPTGKVLFFGPPGSSQTTNLTHAVIWDPASGGWHRVDPPANVYCSGQAMLADGQVLVAGGTLDREGGASGTRPRGLKTVYTFDPFTETWTEQPDMQEARWYPTQTLLPDGRQVIIGGAEEYELDSTPESDANTIEIFNPAPSRGEQGTVTQLGGTRADPSGPGQPPTSRGELYPHLFVMPSGDTLVAGPDQQDSWFLKTPGSAGAPIEWEDVPNSLRRRTYGNSVLMPPPPGSTTPSTKVMQIGGFQRGDPAGQGALNSSETFDENDSTPSWDLIGDDYVLDRAHQNTVLLPDGSMAAVGGGTGASPTFYSTTAEHKKVELFDPTSGPGEPRWRLGAAQADARAYHSVAVLLPDGRVVSAGDDGNTTKSVSGPGMFDSAEIYEPPYLFKGDRPTISWAPSATSWGRSFGVSTPNTDISRAVLIAPGATTHAADMHQRYVPLEVTRRAGGVDLKAPRDANVAPPGYYMLFLVNEAGVPSIAKFVRLMPNAPVETDPSQGGDGTGGGTETGTGGGTETGTGGGTETGTGGGTTVTDTADLLAPRIESLTLSSRRLRAAASRSSASAAPARTRVRYRLSEASTARFTLQRAVRPRRYRRVRGSLSRSGAQGPNSFLLRARFGGRNLRPGNYRLTLVATDAAGNRSSAKRVAFRVVAR